MDIGLLFKDYGWFVAITLYFLPKLWVFLVDKFYPQKIKEREKAQEEREQGVRAEREARATLIKAQIDREATESQHRMQMDARTVTALEQMALAVTAGNERITALIASHTQHANFQFGAHIELKDRLDDIQEMITYRQKVDDIERRLSDTQDIIKKSADKK